MMPATKKLRRYVHLLFRSRLHHSPGTLRDLHSVLPALTHVMNLFACPIAQLVGDWHTDAAQKVRREPDSGFCQLKAGFAELLKAENIPNGRSRGLCWDEVVVGHVANA